MSLDLNRPGFFETPDKAGMNDGMGRGEVRPPALTGPLSVANHVVQFYESDAFLLDIVGRFIGTSLRNGDAGVVIATTAHLDELGRQLATSGLDIEEAVADSRYLPLDAQATLSEFMAGAEPDAGRFEDLIGGLMDRAGAGGRNVRVFGEMVSLLKDDGNHAAAVSLERLWSQAQARHGFTILCAYPVGSWSSESFAKLHGEVCAEHSEIYPSERYAELSTAEEMRRAIAVLEQKARWLEVEIEQRKQAEAKVSASLAAERAAREEALAALQSRDDFIAITAHDLRSPLATLSALSQFALRRIRRDGRLGLEESVNMLESMAAQVTRLSRLTDNLINDSRLARGSLTLDVHPADLSELVTQAVVDARVRGHGQLIEVTTPETCVVPVDSMRMEQVLTNLLDNAIKYNPAGHPIEVLLTRTADREIELSVRDFGPGIPAERRVNIFERFYQAGDSQTEGYRSGLGLGLYICRQIVELHGGEIQAEFPSDGGTRIVIRLFPDTDSPPQSRDQQGDVSA